MRETHVRTQFPASPHHKPIPGPHAGRCSVHGVEAGRSVQQNAAHRYLAAAASLSIAQVLSSAFGTNDETSTYSGTLEPSALHSEQ